MENEQDKHILIAKYFAGEALPEEAMAVDDWRTLSPSNSSEFDRFAKIFMPDHQWNEQAGWQKIMSMIANRTGQVKRFNPYRKYGIAASIILLLTVITFLFILNTRNRSSSEIVYQTNTTSTEIQLADSSLILIHPNSTIIVSRGFGMANRSLVLKGSAKFKVRHDSTKPFIVDIENLHIRDIGTIFTVTTFPYKDSVQVKVEEGEVIVYESSRESINLIAGQEAVYIRQGKEFVLPSVSKISLKSDTGTEKNNTNLEKRLTVAQFQGKAENRYTEVSIDEAEKIINQQVTLISKDSSFRNGVSTYSGHFRAITDETNSLFYTMAYHRDSILAHSHYIESVKSNSGAAEMESMLKYGAEAVYQTDKQTIYRIIFRKKNITYSLWITKLKSGVSINELIKKAKQAAQAIH